VRNRQIAPLELLTQLLRVRTVLAHRQKRLDQLLLLAGELPARHDRLATGFDRQD
jgi:hypothetical protein